MADQPTPSAQAKPPAQAPQPSGSSTPSGPPAGASSPAKPQSQTQPQSKDQAQTSGGEGRKYDIKFNGQSTAKLQVPDSVDVRAEWQDFQDQHSHVSDKRRAFPTSFVGHLVNDLGATQLDKGESTDETIEFRVS